MLPALEAVKQERNKSIEVKLICQNRKRCGVHIRLSLFRNILLDKFSYQILNNLFDPHDYYVFCATYTLMIDTF